MKNKTHWIIVGTRPEVIKQVPVYRSLVARHGPDAVALIGTGQHRELLDQALQHFGVKLDLNLETMRPSQSLTESSSAILEGMGALLREHRPRWLVVQGDTTSAAMAAWAAFQAGVKVAHNEAGLRSYDLQHPFPEEANRRLISIVSQVHFAPTERSKAALLREGIAEDLIHVTGNTGIDALRWTLDLPRPDSIQFVLKSLKSKNLRPVLLTAHRRENKESMDLWFRALAQFLIVNPDLGLIYPIHPNHLAKAAADRYLSATPQAHLVPALNYGETCHLLSECDLVVTDSGGIQEEAATLGIPTIVCRQTTERMEAVDAGIAKLAGTNADSILSSMLWALRQPKPPRKGLQHDLFGDGYAADRIADLLF